MKFCKVKSYKFHPRTGHEGPGLGVEAYLYSFFNPDARLGVGGQRHSPPDIPSGKTRYPLYRRLGGPHGRSGYEKSRPHQIRPMYRPFRSQSIYIL